MITTAPKSSLPSTIADRYRVIDRLGAGGMATVYLAAMDGPGGFGKLVAIKRIHPHLAHEARFVEMFLDEARIVSRIDHPNVCSVLDFGQTEDTYYLAMEYIMGENLLSSLRALKGQQAMLGSARWHAFSAFIIAEACEGLHSAHELGDEFGKPLNIVHRDVSPDNIFVSYQGEVRVMDFGIARAEGRMHRTTTGVVKGKISYMPPEMLNAEPDVDRRVDVWALGVCLWQMLTGKPLFKRPSEAATIAAIAMDDVPPPSSVNPSVPADLDAIVLGALARERTDRTASARALSEHLRRFISDAGVRMDRMEAAGIIEILHSDSKAKKMAQRQSIQQQSGHLAAVIPPNLNSAEFAAQFAAQFDNVATQASGHGPGATGPARDASTSSVPMTEVPSASRAGGLPAHAAIVSPPNAPTTPRARPWWMLPAIGLLAVGLLGAGFAIATMRGGGDDDATARAPARGGAADVGAGTQLTNPEEPSTGTDEAGSQAGPSEDGVDGDSSALATDSAPSAPATTIDDGARAKKSERKSSRSRRRRDRKRADKARSKTNDSAQDSTSDDGKSVDPAPKPDPVEKTPAPDPIEKIAPPEPKKKLIPPTPTSFVAKTDLKGISTSGSLSRNKVKRAISRKQSAMARCYESAAKKAGRNAACSVRVEFKIDDTRRVRNVSAKGASLPGLNSCVEGVVKGIRSKEAPDTGDARVSFEIDYAPKAR